MNESTLSLRLGNPMIEDKQNTSNSCSKTRKKQPAWELLRLDQHYTYRNRSIFSGSSILRCFPANCSAIQARISVHFSILAVRSARLGRILHCYDDSESIPCSIVRLPPPSSLSLADQTPRVFRPLRIPITFWWCFLLVFPFPLSSVVYLFCTLAQFQHFLPPHTGMITSI